MKLRWEIVARVVALALASVHFLFVIAAGPSAAQSMDPAFDSPQELISPEGPPPQAAQVLPRGAFTEREVTADYVQEACYCEDLDCFAVVGASYVTALRAARQRASDSTEISRLHTALVDCIRQMTPERDETWERRMTSLREQERQAFRSNANGLNLERRLAGIDARRP
jgi:hypothetical protein